jgi:hypothetical protein
VWNLDHRLVAAQFQIARGAAFASTSRRVWGKDSAEHGYRGVIMAKYGKKATKSVKKAMHKKKKGTLKSGTSGQKVTSRKQAIAIGLSEARKKGAKVPKKKTAEKK